MARERQLLHTLFCLKYGTAKTMSTSEKKQYMQDLVRGLRLSEYRMLRDKAMRNLTIIQGDGKGGWREVSAREVFVKLYNEPVPTF